MVTKVPSELLDPIDGIVIGGTTPAAGSFTTGSFSGQVKAGGSESFRARDAAPYYSFYNAAESTRFGYIQHTGTNLALVNEISGDISLGNPIGGITLESTGNATFTGGIKAAGLQVTGSTVDATAGSSFEAISAADIVYAAAIDRAGALYRELRHTASSFDWATTPNTATSRTIRMTLDASGNVGIGATSPTSDAIVRFLHLQNATSAGVVMEGTRRFSIYSSSSGSLEFRDESLGSGRMTLDASGTLDVTNSVKSSRFNSESGTSSQNTGVATTIFSLSNKPGLWTVFAYLAGTAAAAYTAEIVVANTGTSYRVLRTDNGTNLTLSLSGGDVQVTQTSGTTQTVTYSAFNNGAT